MDPNDGSVLDAVKREVAEETGLTNLEVIDPLFDVDVHDIPPRKQELRHQHFDIRVLLRARELTAAAGSDAMAVRWVPLDKVEDIESDQSVIRAIEKIDNVRRGKEL